MLNESLAGQKINNDMFLASLQSKITKEFNHLKENGPITAL